MDNCQASHKVFDGFVDKINLGAGQGREEPLQEGDS